jgi:hypothetical protein
MAPLLPARRKAIKVAAMLHAGPVLVAALAISTASSLSSVASGAPERPRGPYLTDLSEGGVVVRVELAAPAPVTVRVTRESGTSAARVFESPVASMHDVAVGGLEPAVSYRYAVRSGSAVLGEGRFVTAPKGGSDAPLTFLVYGDDRSDVAAHTSVARAMSLVRSDFLVNTGDLVDDASIDGEWQSFFDVEASLLSSRPIFAAMGNHETVHDPSGTRFLRYFGFRDAGGTARPYGTVRLGGVRLFFLDARQPWGSGDERSWLEQELDRSDGEAGTEWRIVVVHEGPWSAGPHGPSEALLEARVPELLAAHKIDLVLSGHDHTYQRGDAGAIKYIVSGGAGAPLYEIARSLPTTRKALSAYHFVEIRTAPDQIRIVAHTPDGREIDRCAFRKGSAWDCDAPPPPPSSPPSPPSAPTASQSPRSAQTGCSVGAGPGSTRSPKRGESLAGAGLSAAWSARRRRRRG